METTIETGTTRNVAVMKRVQARNERGVALLSLVLMGSAILVVASAMIPVTMSIIDYEKRARTQEKIQLIQTALQDYYLDTNQFPGTTGTAPLRRLYTNVDNLASWQGPYLPGPASDYLFDEWRNPLVYNVGTSTTVGPVAMVMSSSRNRATDSNLDTWTTDNWATAGDDIGTKVDTTGVIDELRTKNLNLLLGFKALIYAASSATPPTSVTNSSYTDAWGHLMVYRKCHNFAAVLYSYGMNGVDDSSGGSNICLIESTGGDDMFIPLEWDISATATGLAWKGGFGGNPDICRSYQMKITNLYPNVLTVNYRDTVNVLRTQTIAGLGNATINGVAPAYSGAWAVLVSYNNNAIEGFSPILLDLNGDCIVSKLYGYQF